MLKKPVTFHVLHSPLWPLLLLIGANGLIISQTFPSLRYAAALILLTFLPGWVWLNAFFDHQLGDETEAPLIDLPERITLAIGLALALSIFAAMFAVYLPGPLGLSPLLIMIDTFTLAGLVTHRLQHRSRSQGAFGWPQRATSSAKSPVGATLPSLGLLAPSLLLVAALLLLAAALRLPRLGYAEFHEDEAEALMLGVRLMQGEDYALFLHRKGPAQMLIPLSVWLLTGQITEALARFPFALSSMLSTAALFFIGRRWFNWQVGAIAGLLWAVNGYAIGFGRMVQYQALIFFLGPLALFCLYLAGTDRLRIGRWLILGAILLAACLLAHFDALLLLPAAAYLGRVAMSRGPREQGSRGEVSPPLHRRSPAPLQAAAVALTLFLVLLASFYIPYLLDPEFRNTANYLAESRVKPGLLYNNLDLLRRLDKDYSSHYYLPLLLVGLSAFIVWPGLTQKKWSAAFSTVEARAAWLMFGAGFIGYVFLVDDPRTHLYIMYPGAVLLAGAGWAGIMRLPLENTGWAEKQHPTVGLHLCSTQPTALLRLFILIVAGLLVGGIVAYEVMIFLPTESVLDKLRQRWDVSWGEVVYGDLPKAREYFGYPKREGWKAIGALRAQGLFPGDFRSVNEDFIIPIWYNYGQARSCYDTPAQFFVRTRGYDFYIPEQQIQAYSEAGWIEREGEVRLRVFSREDAPEIAAPVYSLEALADAFDQLATPQRFIHQADPTQPVPTQFGPAIQFLGYDLPVTAVAPGETLPVNLYWRALQHPDHNYRAFVHLTDGVNLWGQQDDDPACRLPTSIWRVGQRGLGQFRLSIKPETPPGRYPLIIGLYQAETLERLKITAGAGQAGDDFLWLGDVQVVKQ